MNILGTKDRTEREEEEAERLVRPLPKVKPPRHDRRREEMRVDRDPDVEGDSDIKRDPDLSMNRREIGGSVNHIRGLIRSILAGEAAEKLVRVWDNQEKEIASIPETTLKGPSKARYKRLKPGETPGEERPESGPKLKVIPGESQKGKFDRSRPKLEALEGEKEKADSKGQKPSKVKLTDEELAANLVKKWKASEKHKAKDFQEFGDSIPTSVRDEKTGEVLFLDPRSEKKVPFERLPNKEKSRLIQEFSKKKEQVGKERAEKDRVQREQLAIKRSLSNALKDTGVEAVRVLQELADPASEASKNLKEIVSQGHKAEHLDIAKTFPGLQGVDWPESIRNVADLVRVAKPFKIEADKEKAEAKRKAEEKAKADAEEAKKWEAPAPPKVRRKVSELEKKSAIKLLTQTFPVKIALRYANEHPDDIHAIIENYNAAKEALAFKGSKEAIKSLSEVRQGFTLDPMKVKPPEELDGKKLSELHPEEKANAMHSYRMAQVGRSIALRKQAIQGVRSTGIRPGLASKLVDHLLASGFSDPVEYRKKTLEAARNSFVTGGTRESRDARFGVDIRTSEASTPSGPRKELLKSIGDNPDLQMLAIASFQGEDYQEALRKFAITHRDSPETVVQKLKEADDFFAGQGKGYPPEVTRALDDPAQVFRTRMRSKLSLLGEDEAVRVRQQLAKLESNKYLRDQKDFFEAQKKYDSEKKQWEQEKKQHEMEQASKPEHLREFFTIPVPIEPLRPVKPIDFDTRKRSRDPSKREAPPLMQRLLDKFKRKTANPYSIYSVGDRQRGTLMPREHVREPVRTALYHGVQPYPAGREGFAPYVGWEQAHIRDLGTQDFSMILESAKKWLASPVLSKSIEGMVPDSRFRAALDLAIRDFSGGNYSSAINTNLYNLLLAKLAGEPQTETLLTIREASSNRTEGNMTLKFAKDEANKILGRLDRVAEVIQVNAERWNMPFKVAKGIVNDLDKCADEIEKATFGEGSLACRQVEVLKSAKVLQQDSDEGYMGTFNAPTAPKQTDADEPYMSLFKDDQTVAVHDGKSTTGRPLAP